MTFDVVSLWEVLEHIAEPDLAAVFRNILAHLEPGGLVIASISSDDTLAHHQTVQDQSWWATMFRKHGLTPVPEFVRYFATQFIRGPKYGAVGSFHLVATNDPALAPDIPPVRIISVVLDRLWYGSTLYWQVRRLLGIQ